MGRQSVAARAAGALVLAGVAFLSTRAVGPRCATARVRLMAAPGSTTPDAKFRSSAPDLKYYGGPVLQNVKVYNVNWGTHINATVTAQMPSSMPTSSRARISTGCPSTTPSV